MLESRLVHLLQSKKVNASDVSRATGISTGLLSYYKRGEKDPSLQNLEKLADYFGVTTDYLLGRDEKAPASDGTPGQDDVMDEIAGKVSLLSDAGREALSAYIDLLLMSEGKKEP